ncbi:hypothetical protein HPB51_003166 [Rhipicephalus microplus]|uniref:Uncharacterized protein n=1 Tax=Rhipicephalus microplus TaxID=6941 RepID=A0A9J6EKR9_RHIMP|nr:hypothetical protein HPB51_003166 [Rhipicephalus microplus]
MESLPPRLCGNRGKLLRRRPLLACSRVPGHAWSREVTAACDVDRGGTTSTYPLYGESTAASHLFRRRVIGRCPRCVCECDLIDMWGLTSQSHHMIMRDAVVEGSGNLDHLGSFNAHRNLSTRAYVSATFILRSTWQYTYRQFRVNVVVVVADISGHWHVEMPRRQ